MEPPSLDYLPTFLTMFRYPGVDVMLAMGVELLLLVCSGLISGSEVAFFSLRPADREILLSERTKTSERVLALLERPQRLLATILITNNLVNVGIVILSTFIIAGTFNFEAYPLWVSFAVQVGAVTFLLLLLGEIVPKVYATVNILPLCKFMSLPLEVLMKVLYPLSSVLMRSTTAINKRVKKRTAEYSSDEMEHALALTKDAETTPEEEKILKGIVRFGNTDVKQILTPRTEVVAFDITTPYAELLEELLEQGFSRVPVFRETLDQIIGILYLKDLLPHAEEVEFNWQTLIRKPYFVPENKKLDDLLQEFQKKKVHMTIVVDEYGGTSGIVTLEDIIEEIVGDITDEFDDEDIFYSKLDEQNYVFEGKTPLVDLYKILDIEGDNFEEAKGESDTLAGFMLELTGKIPAKNEKLKFENYILTVEAADKRRIKRIKLTITENETISQDKSSNDR